ncbi:hypothetical protein AURDEDRAFT_121981 [Auricularia subglabra TFB-10046 SS5]|nr:hypothetical protein AURDEDRAFT_121981 [Auricularia subglabra TFB-10046 SS5]
MEQELNDKPVTPKDTPFCGQLETDSLDSHTLQDELYGADATCLPELSHGDGRPTARALELDELYAEDAAYPADPGPPFDDGHVTRIPEPDERRGGNTAWHAESGPEGQAPAADGPGARIPRPDDRYGDAFWHVEVGLAGPAADLPVARMPGPEERCGDNASSSADAGPQAPADDPPTARKSKHVVLWQMRYVLIAVDAKLLIEDIYSRVVGIIHAIGWVVAGLVAGLRTVVKFLVRHGPRAAVISAGVIGMVLIVGYWFDHITSSITIQWEPLTANPKPENVLGI